MTISTFTRRSILCLSLSIMSIACADMSDADLSEAYVKTFNQSAKVVYRCEVQTITARWVSMAISDR